MTITYSGPSTASAFAVGVMNDAWTQVGLLENEAAIATAALNATKRSIVAAPLTEDIPSKYVGVDNQMDIESVNADADWSNRSLRLVTARNAVVSDIATDAKAFFKTYFNDGLDGSAVYDDATSWINGLLLSGGTGVAAEASLRLSDIARINADGLRAVADINAGWAVRGFVLPARVAAFQTRQVGYVTGDALGEAERNARIHSWDAEVANTKWANERSLQLRADAIDRCRAFITDWVRLRYEQINARENEQILKTKEVQDAYYQFMQNELDLRDVVIDRYLTAFQTSTMPKWKNKEELKRIIYEQRVNALQHRLHALATRASAAINSIHVQAEATASEQV